MIQYKYTAYNNYYTMERGGMEPHVLFLEL